MTPNASTWRSSADYEHLDVLTPLDLAWEWLRRNDAYDADFEASASGQGDPEPLTERIRQRWDSISPSIRWLRHLTPRYYGFRRRTRASSYWRTRHRNLTSKSVSQLP